jgi:murein DD-endopeptidase MepM/ murein hydrolase activator NlpD
MMQKTNRTIYGIIFFTLALLLIPHSSNASIIDTLKQKITEKADQIKNLEKEIFKFQTDLVNVSKEKSSLQGELQSLDSARKKLDTNIVSTEKNISATASAISSIQKEIGDKEESIEKSKEAVKDSMRTIQLAGDESVIEKMLSEDSLSEAGNAADQTLYYREALRSHIVDLMDYKTELVEAKDEYEGKKVVLSKQKQELSGQKSSVLATKQEKDKLLAATKNKEAEYQRTLAEKLAQKAQYEKEMFQIESELKIAIDPSKLPTIGPGVLSWPLQSVYITQYFGATVAAQRLYVSGSHNGVDLRATDGTKVMTALSGTVWATGNTDAKVGCYSYGKWVLVRHDNGLSTLYGHLSSVAVSANQAVTTGDAIGYSGRTGYVTGPHLHFTVLATEGTRVMQIPPERSTKCAGVTIPIGDTKAYLDPMLYLPKF